MTKDKPEHVTQETRSLQHRHFFSQEIAPRLRAVRRKARLTQPEFAQRLGVSPRAYANYERGERTINARMMMALYDHFQVDPVWLLSGPEAMQYLRTPYSSELLIEVIVKVEEHQERSPNPLPPEAKARLVVLLYIYCQAKGRVRVRVRQEYIEHVLSRMPTEGR